MSDDLARQIAKIDRETFDLADRARQAAPNAANGGFLRELADRLMFEHGRVGAADRLERSLRKAKEDMLTQADVVDSYRNRLSAKDTELAALREALRSLAILPSLGGGFWCSLCRANRNWERGAPECHIPNCLAQPKE